MHIVARELDFNRIMERHPATICLQHAKIRQQLGLVLLQFDFLRREELDFHLQGFFAIPEVNFNHQLKILRALVVAFRLQQQL